MRLKVEVRDLRAEEKAAHARWHFEADETDFLQRVHHDHLPAPPLQLHQLGDQTRMVARRVRPRDEGDVRMGQVVQRHRTRARAVHLVQRDPGGLVAVEAAVVDVRRPVGPCHELEQEGRLVARTPGRVEEHLIRLRLFQARRRPVQRFVPGDAPEVRVAFVRGDWEGQPPELLQFTRRERLQLRNRRFAEERLRDEAVHIAGLRLGRFLADLGEVPGFVHHPAVLPTHAHGARLAGVLRTHALVELPVVPRLVSLLERVDDCGHAAASRDSGLRHTNTLGTRLALVQQETRQDIRSAVHGEPGSLSGPLPQ